MEHRHIPASKDGSIPSAKTRFWLEENADAVVSQTDDFYVQIFHLQSHGCQCDGQDIPPVHRKDSLP